VFLASIFNNSFNRFFVLNHFDKIVHYQLCDFLYDEFKINTNKRGIGYTTFTNLCSVVSTKIINGVDFSKTERILINKTLDRLTSFFGFSNKEASTYLVEFFYKKFWEKIYGSITAINSVFNLSKNI
jgi:hypothetical protein